MPEHRAAAEPGLARGLRDALEARNLEALGALLAPDVRWGDLGHPRTCTNRDQVLATFRAAIDAGASGRVGECVDGEHGVLCELLIDWPDPAARPDDAQVYQVYLVRDGLVSEIRRYDDRASAARAAGVRP
jgi:hypothetical protein